MKKNYILLVLFLMILQTKAQSFYTQSTLNQAYSDLVNPVSVNNGEAWNNSYYGPFETPFAFKIAGQLITHFGFENDYFVFLAGTGIDDTTYTFSAPGIYIQDKNYDTNTSVSPLSYKVEGEVGNRILKIEIKNAGSETESAIFETNNLFLNVQIWIYEGTDVIEYRYGNSNITATDIEDIKEEQDFLLVAIADPSFTYANFVSGNPASPNFTEIFNGNIIEISLDDYVLTSYPASGTVFRFTPSTTVSTDEFNKARFSIYPNPATEILHISLEKMNVSGYSITDMTGKIIRTGSFTSLETTLEIGDLSSGMYFIRIGDTTQKFFKK